MKPKQAFCYRLPLRGLRQNAALHSILFYWPTWTEEAPNISPFLSFLKARIGVLTCSRGIFSSRTEIQAKGLFFVFLFFVFVNLSPMFLAFEMSAPFFWLHEAGAGRHQSDDREPRVSQSSP